MNTRLRGESPPRQDTLVPDRMCLVADWATPEGDRLELYIDPRPAYDDGIVLAVTGKGTEQAATVTKANDSLTLTWAGTLADREPMWRNAQAAIARQRVAKWRESEPA